MGGAGEEVRCERCEMSGNGIISREDIGEIGSDM